MPGDRPSQRVAPVRPAASSDRLAQRVAPRVPVTPSDSLSERAAAAPATPTVPLSPPPAFSVSAVPTTEMPLFVKGRSAGDARMEPASSSAPMSMAESEVPMVSVPAEPRAPLAVQRKAPDTRKRPRQQTAARKSGAVDGDLLDGLQGQDRLDRVGTSAGGGSAGDRLSESRAGAFKRGAAAFIDAAILGALSVAVLAITLRWCDLTFASLAVLPALPVAAFLALIGVAYLLMFTAAGGQTLGKMALGIRVVADNEGGSGSQPMSISQAAYRAVLTVPGVLALGAGFVPGLIGQELAVHDRLAHTRVVRA
jgi:uncharacterized RDD family membrane protein YckC